MNIALLTAPSSIFGVRWAAGTTSPVLARTGAARGRVANVGIDSAVVANDFDRIPPWSEMQTVTDDLGNVFVRIPKFYIRKTVTGIEISMKRYAGFYLPRVFWDFTNSRELPHYDHGAHMATLAGSALESKPDVYPLINTHIVDFRTYAQANNTGGRAGYQQLDIHAHDLITALMDVEFATFDAQSLMQGYIAGVYSATHVATATEAAANRIIVATATAAAYRVGQTISVGSSLGGNQRFYGRTITAIEDYDASNKAVVFDGAAVNITTNDVLYNTGWKTGFSASIAASSGSVVANNGKYPCSYRGIESPYGDILQWVDGVNINDLQAWVCANAADYSSNLFASPYEQLSYVNHNADGYATEMGLDTAHPEAQFPTAVDATLAQARYRDNYYQTTGQHVALVGGYWLGGSSSGLRCWALGNASSNADTSVGGRLLRKAL